MKQKKQTSKEFRKSLSEGLKYPWNSSSKLWNILWVIIPIFGWFALVGYFKKIVRELIKGRRKQLPAFGSFSTNFKQGVLVTIYLIPTFFALSILNLVPLIGNILSLLASVFLVPWLIMDFFVKETFDSLWNIKKTYNIVFDNAKDYIWAYLKTLVYGLIYGLLSIVIIGIPCLMFGKFYFLTEFYRKYK